MDVLTLSRIQFGGTIAFHYIYPPLSIGLGIMLVLMEGAWLKTGNNLYHQMARFWTKVFALTFAIGVATGIVMEFEFGTNWATYSRFVGDVFGSALAAEGIFAFFLESGFLAVLLFGWNKVGRKLHFFSTCMVALGAHFSAVWIVVANSWMQTPAGYPLLVGVTTVALFMMHGAIYGVMKTEGELHDKLRIWAMRCIIFFVICTVTLTMATLLFVPHMAARVRENPWLFSVALANMLAIANIPREFHHGNDGRAFLSSCATIITLMTLFALNIFPNMIYSLPNPENSLTIYNAASSPKTLGIMLVIACIGVPVVIAYTVCIYWIFRGKVKLDRMSY